MCKVLELLIQHILTKVNFQSENFYLSTLRFCPNLSFSDPPSFDFQKPTDSILYPKSATFALRLLVCHALVVFSGA